MVTTERIEHSDNADKSEGDKDPVTDNDKSYWYQDISVTSRLHKTPVSSEYT